MNEVIREDQVYRPAEIAEALRVSTVTLTRAIRDGKLKAFRVGGQWRILGEEVVRYIDQETKKARITTPN
jgi:putative resolvase